MKTAECDIQAVKNKILYWEIHQSDQIYLDSWRGIFQQSLNMYWMNSLFKWLRMLPLKVIFQSLDGKYFFYMEFQLYKCKNRQFHSKWFIAVFSQIYLSGNWHYYILLIFVLIFINYTKVIEREPVSLQQKTFESIY